MAIIVSSSDTEDSPMTSYMSPAPAAIRIWGKQYMMDAMREHGFPVRIAYSTAVGHYSQWMGLKGAPLLRAVWQAMEPAEGPEFCASFEKIFGRPFWPLVHHLEGALEAPLSENNSENDAAGEDEACNTDLDTPGETADALPAFHTLFEEDGDAQSASQSSNTPAMAVQRRPSVNTADPCLEQAEESPMTTDASADST